MVRPKIGRNGHVYSNVPSGMRSKPGTQFPDSVHITCCQLVESDDRGLAATLEVERAYLDDMIKFVGPYVT